MRKTGRGHRVAASTVVLVAGALLGSPRVGWSQCADLAIGAIRDDEAGPAESGNVNVLQGTLAGLGVAGEQLWTQDSPGVPGTAEVGDWLGFRMASGDFDGDHDSDLAISAVWEAIGALEGAGAVNVLYGTLDGLSGDGAQVLYQGAGGILETAEVEDFFGSALAVGDFDGDGRDDLVVGASGEALGGLEDAGVVHVIFGSAAGLAGDGDQLWSQDTSGVTGTVEADDHFGYALAVGDFDGSGRVDLAIGVIGEDLPAPERLNAGAVQVLYNDGSGLGVAADDYWTRDGVLGPGEAEAGDSFGLALAAGNFDGDAYDDLAIAAPYVETGLDASGAVTVLYGSASGLTVADADEWTQDLLGGDLGDDYFGYALAAGDFNRDGYDDLAVGVPNEDLEGGTTLEDAGATYVLYGSAAGLKATGALLVHRGFESVEGEAAARDRFGYSLGAGDLNCDGADDLVIGVPQNYGSHDGPGSVNVIYGIPVIGIFPIGDELFSQDTPGVSGTAHDYEHFGYQVLPIPDRRSVFVDDFESGDTGRWSDEAP